jgi:hypothetical protein
MADVLRRDLDCDPLDVATPTRLPSVLRVRLELRSEGFTSTVIDGWIVPLTWGFADRRAMPCRRLLPDFNPSGRSFGRSWRWRRARRPRARRCVCHGFTALPVDRGAPLTGFGLSWAPASPCCIRLCRSRRADPRDRARRHLVPGSHGRPARPCRQVRAPSTGRGAPRRRPPWRPMIGPAGSWQPWRRKAAKCSIVDGRSIVRGSGSSGTPGEIRDTLPAAFRQR